MIFLVNVSIEDIYQILAEVEGKRPERRPMAASKYFEDDDTTL